MFHAVKSAVKTLFLFKLVDRTKFNHRHNILRNEEGHHKGNEVCLLVINMLYMSCLASF